MESKRKARKFFRQDQQHMPKIVFSNHIMETWGADLASTLVNDGEEQQFLDLYERINSTFPSSPVEDGDVIVYSGREYMVLELTPEEQNRLSEARTIMAGAPGEKMMICELLSELTRKEILPPGEVERRRGRCILL